MLIGALAHRVSHLPMRAEAIANANLIAAAPELLEACKKHIAALAAWDAAFEHWSGDSTALTAAGNASEEAETLMRAAIAKAEGKNN